MALSLGELMPKESRHRGGRRTGEDKQDGGIKIGTLTPNDNNDMCTLWGV